MFDIGGWEFLFIVVIAIVVIGPKDLPGTIRTITGWIRRARELAREFQSGLDDIARDVDLESVKDEIQSGVGLDDFADAKNSIRNDIESTVDPDGEIRRSFNEEDALDGDDDPFLKDYLDEDEDDELDDIDPKYRTAERQTDVETDQTVEAELDDKGEKIDSAAVEAAKKA